MSESNYLSRLLSVLDAVVDAEVPPTAMSIGERLGIPQSTAFRLLTDLIDRGLLQRADSGEIAPGARLLHLGLRTLGRWGGTRELEDLTVGLAAQIPESVSAGLLVGDEIVLVARQEPDSPLRVVARVGDIIAPHVSALGKAILAQLEPARMRRVLVRAVGSAEADAFADKLAVELDDTRRLGFAVDEGEYALGQRCRAVALVNGVAGVYGGLSVAGPSARFSVAHADAAARLLGEAAAAVTRTQELRREATRD
jgi:DNA-binding IclR family transcriptional regulator